MSSTPFSSQTPAHSEIHSEEVRELPFPLPGSGHFELPLAQAPFILSEASEAEWCDFVENHPYGDVLQTPEWAKLKAPTWSLERIIVRDACNHLVAGAQMLLRPLPGTAGKLKLAYCPRGPVLNWNDGPLRIFVLQALKQKARSLHALSLSIDPALLRTDWWEILQTDFRHSGYEHKGFYTDMREIQPRYNRMLPLQDIENYLKSRNSSLRWKINKSQKSPFILHSLEAHQMEEFFALMEETGARDNIRVRNLAYYEKLNALFTPRDRKDFFLLSLCPAKAIKQNEECLTIYQKELIQAQKKLERLSEEKRQNKLKDIEDRKHSIQILEEEQKMLQAEKRTEIPLACAALLYTPKRCTYLYAGSSNLYRNKFPVIKLLLECMKQAEKRGCIWFDLGGVSGANPQEDPVYGGLEIFKKSLGSELIEYVGEYTVVLHPLLNTLLQNALRLRKKLLHRKR